jgi:hypothetical protein
MLFWKLLFSLLVTLLLFECMVTAFHLLNLPSDRAVVEGSCLLLVMAVAGFFSYRKLWRL